MNSYYVFDESFSKNKLRVELIQKEVTAWCYHNLCGNSAVPTRIVGTENLFPIGCSDKFVGTTVPTKIVGTPNGGFLLAVPTNLSEQYTFYNAA